VEGELRWALFFFVGRKTQEQQPRHDCCYRGSCGSHQHGNSDSTSTDAKTKRRSHHSHPYGKEAHPAKTPPSPPTNRTSNDRSATLPRKSPRPRTEASPPRAAIPSRRPLGRCNTPDGACRNRRRGWRRRRVGFSAVGAVVRGGCVFGRR